MVSICLAQMYRYLFTGPSSANKPPGAAYVVRGRGSLSRIHRVNEVRPEYLAYVVMLVCTFRTRVRNPRLHDNQIVDR